MKEFWKSISGFYGLYDVSNFGRVRSLKTGIILKPQRGKNCRYDRVSLYSKEKPRGYIPSIHILVAEAFIGPRPRGLVLNHKDGNRSNNSANNLEYITQKENMRHAKKMGLLSNPTDNYARRASMTSDKVREIINMFVKDQAPVCLISRRTGVRADTIRFILKKKSWPKVNSEFDYCYNTIMRTITKRGSMVDKPTFEKIIYERNVLGKKLKYLSQKYGVSPSWICVKSKDYPNGNVN